MKSYETLRIIIKDKTPYHEYESIFHQFVSDVSKHMCQVTRQTQLTTYLLKKPDMIGVMISFEILPNHKLLTMYDGFQTEEQFRNYLFQVLKTVSVIETLKD